MKYLGIDYGKARIGLSISDDEGKIAFPRQNLEISDPAAALQAILELTAAEAVGEIIIGLPAKIAGIDSTIRDEVLEFADRLREESGLPVSFEDESFTTRMAAEHSSRNLDSSAAALILQSFLDRKGGV